MQGDSAQIEVEQPRFQSPDEFSVHRQLVFWLFISTGLLTGVTAIVLIGADRNWNGLSHVTILPIVAISGTLGAFVSSLRRLYSHENIFPSLRFGKMFRGVNLYIAAYSSIPALVGAIAATILYVVFASQLIETAIFPKFVCETSNCEEFEGFLKHWRPAHAPDYAKAIVWGFIAGFSERFVPDILNQLSSKQSKQTGLTGNSNTSGVTTHNGGTGA